MVDEGVELVDDVECAVSCLPELGWIVSKDYCSVFNGKTHR